MREPRRIEGSLRAVGLFAAAVMLATGPVFGADEAGLPPGGAYRASDLDTLKTKYRRPDGAPFPEDNAYAPAKAELGKLLFFDPRLSGSNTLACGGCHNPNLSWEDGLPRAVGHGMKPLARRTATLFNVAWGAAYMWDGRASTLEEQALLPIQSPDEMNQPLNALVEELAAIAEYRERFALAFPGEEITIEGIAKGVATYERTIVSGTAPFDRWFEGDETAISEAAKRGFVLFNTKAKCSRCHAGWRFTDDSFHDIGLPGEDLGRGAFFPDVTVMQHAFKTPGLRNVALRGPYMHDGSIADLGGVIDHYDEGGIDRPSRSAEIGPLDLSAQEERDLLAFLETLTSEEPRVAIPRLPADVAGKNSESLVQ
jgi:cytochrome c peroxidase